ncbi:hypothetical protein [Arthrobacter sp. JSM 101049]|uniref:hypothetical protein n=1 Tax=Arthrobacter sp. JSM 101049 TaxID=929097 RepID=UPI003566113F
MGMFNKLANKGKQMAGQYLREQLAERQSQRPAPPHGGHRPGNADRQGAPASGSPASGSVARSGAAPAPGSGAPVADEDAAAIAKYKYMLRTAPPEDMERAHAEAFARLTPAQRDALQAGLGDELPAGERPRSNQPEDLARSATRAEMAQPGFMERLLGGGNGASRGSGRGFGGLAAGAAGAIGAGLLAGVAGGFIGSAIAGPLLDGFSGIGEGLAGAADGLGDGLGEAAGGLGDSVSGLGDAASGLGDSVAQGGEALSGGGLLDGLFGEGDFGAGGGDGFFGGLGNDGEF